MNNLPPTLQHPDFATLRAEHTRHIQLLSGQFWKGDIDLWRYRKLSRELTEHSHRKLTSYSVGKMGSLHIGEQHILSSCSSTVCRQSSSHRKCLPEEVKIACFILTSLVFYRFTCPNKGTHKFAIHFSLFSLT
jgi:hypothetical protein